MGWLWPPGWVWGHTPASGGGLACSGTSLVTHSSLCVKDVRQSSSGGADSGVWAQTPASALLAMWVFDS